ncbi:hypothetical protein QQP08_025327 [Theobroma cacao]|uniref:Uncharacterized protein n=1 Tax=Theobroma cacao TaxID=3641 RepID=A0A061GVT7_THECC|nr:Uncharacterized protein TCM_041536 [Theobroma cacao]WRX32840.1 hypothetical protein QQP08_025327 [Theobroma cacao]
MDLLQKLQTFLASIVASVIRILPELLQPRSLPEQAPTLPQTATSSINIESPQPQRPTSSPSPSNDHESPQAQLPSPAPTPTTASNLKLQLESMLCSQRHLQWQNAVLAFCFSYALGVSLQFVGTDRSNHQLPFPLVLLSFLVLLTFIFIMLAYFIHSNCTRTTQAVERISLLLAAAAFCQTLSIPFPFELKCAIWAVFVLFLLIVMIFAYLNRNTARC